MEGYEDNKCNRYAVWSAVNAPRFFGQLKLETEVGF